MTEGTRVVRVSLRSDEGKEGERGTIRRVYKTDEGTAHCYNVEWDGEEGGLHFQKRMQLVAPQRIVDEETFEKTRRQMSTHETIQ